MVAVKELGPDVCCVTGNKLSLPLSSSSSDFRDLFAVNSKFRDKEPVHGVRKHSSPSGCNIPSLLGVTVLPRKNKFYLDKKMKHIELECVMELNMNVRSIQSSRFV